MPNSVLDLCSCPSPWFTVLFCTVKPRSFARLHCSLAGLFALLLTANLVRAPFTGPQAVKVAKVAKSKKSKKAKGADAEMKEAGEAEAGEAEAKMADAKSGKSAKAAAFKKLADTVDENKMSFTTVASVGVFAVAAALFTLKRRRLFVEESVFVEPDETTPLFI